MGKTMTQMTMPRLRSAWTRSKRTRRSAVRKPFETFMAHPLVAQLAAAKLEEHVVQGWRLGPHAAGLSARLLERGEHIE